MQKIKLRKKDEKTYRKNLKEYKKNMKKQIKKGKILKKIRKIRNLEK